MSAVVMSEGVQRDSTSATIAPLRCVSVCGCEFVTERDSDTQRVQVSAGDSFQHRVVATPCGKEHGEQVARAGGEIRKWVWVRMWRHGGGSRGVGRPSRPHEWRAVTAGEV
jgi:hypothetical protein